MFIKKYFNKYIKERLKSFDELKIKYLNKNNILKVKNLKFDKKIYDKLENNITYFDFLNINNLYNIDIVYLKIKNENNEIINKNLSDYIEDNIEITDIIDKNSEEGIKTIWHSSSHILGMVLEENYDILLKNGPATNKGFFYEVNFLKEENIDIKILSDLVNEKLKNEIFFENLTISWEDAKNLFYYNPFKIKSITKIKDDIKIFKSGNFIDLCSGPHIYSSKIIENFIINNKEKKKNNNIRIYGISNKFEDKYNHRTIGENLKLFRFEESSPGSPYFLPKGVKIINKILEILRKEYRIRNFMEVNTPLLIKKELWEISGHLKNYDENMYIIKDYGLKPMNCPCHCLIFKSDIRNYNDLPIKYCDFSVLHRNEISGSLTGLTRVRKFQQDDAHIFCRQDQIKDEIKNEIEFLEYFYKLFDLKYEAEISTRPKKYIGDLKSWDLAETMLKESLNATNIKYKINEGDGAFYGPKIDIKIKDINNKEHQLSTIQLDFNLPKNFNLKYKKLDKFEQPVIIHRAILGSIERFLAIILENYKGRLPFFINPNQIMIIPINENYFEFSQKIRNKLFLNNFEVEIDKSNFSFNKKIRNAQIKQFNYIIIIGEKEIKENKLSIRNRDTNKTESFNFDEFLLKIKSETTILSKKYEELIN